MVDFTGCEEVFNEYSGSEKKKTLIYQNRKYLVKFPDPIRQKNKNISYINNAFSEYIGSNIFNLCGLKAQETILGKYIYNNKEKIVCACEDFTSDNHVLLEFERLALSSNPDKKVDTELLDIINILEENKKLIDLEDTKKHFNEMFIIDFLIGNTDRHNGNWGFLLNKENKKVSFSPIYDCGSCLNPLLEDDEVNNLDENEIKNLALNTFSVLKENNKRIHYITYLSSLKNTDVNMALVRIFPKIDLEKIRIFINNITCISVERKSFYLRLIEIRYDILKKIYRKLISE